ncbi:hypothetical protein K432DRAFT_386526 [Lepidopterella palustris CBS 459.81]|uniref:Uncharacterized protein n=1 Tax=Lepidopterella palustris CBS 459.81 TaxID=1314670 RepID=A0A8E2E085_9PEZI|nr:hypothetical protein K432DRAFT_386526 [Lepidopterella palustris CBS 459.81]
MAFQKYELQIIEKSDYSKQHIVSFQGPLPSLAASSIRVQSTVIGLTTNNISYARLGDMPGRNFYAAHPLPFKEGPYSDFTKYARISAWGTGLVIDSTVDFIPTGTKLWGYLPIASLPVDKVVEQSSAKNIIIETSEFRKAVMPVYNYYFVLDKAHAESAKFQGYSALLRQLFETSYALNRLVFAWDPKIAPVNPAGLSPPPHLDTWTKESANLHDATVVIMPASSKTAFSLAYMLRYVRPKGEQPRAIVGVSSAASRSFVEETKAYNTVTLYDAAESEPSKLVQELGLSATSKIVLADFGAREGFKDLWRRKLDAISNNVLFLRVGTAIPERIDPEEDAARGAKEMANLKPNSYPSNTSTQRDAGMKYYGEAEYLEAVDREFDNFIEYPGVQALKLVWGEGMKGPDGVEGGWNRICSGSLGAAEGLVYRLS